MNYFRNFKYNEFMTINRKNFFKVLGVTGVSLATGKGIEMQHQKRMTKLNSQVFCMIQHVVQDARHANLPVLRQMVCLHQLMQ